MKQYRSHLFVLCALAVVLLTGAHNALFNSLMDARFSWHPREASGEIVLVGIDSPSMEKIGVWPWPRRLHAELIGKLESAGVSDIVFDVDFSSPSNPASDKAFADALQKAGGSVVLPAFEQLAGGRGKKKQIYVNRPLPRFSKHAWPASVNVAIGPDGLVRRYSFGEMLDGEFVPSVGALLAGRYEKNKKPYLIDFSIRANSVPTVSYVDVLHGDLATAKMLRGKKVIIGGTALELGDRFNVANGHVISGPMLQILAAESILQGRVLRTSSDAVMLGGLGILALFMLMLGHRFSASLRVIILIGMAVAAESGAIALQAMFPVILDTSLWHAAIASYLAAMAYDEINIRGLIASIAEKRFQRITMSLGDGLICADRNGMINVCNPAAAAIFGYESKEMTGRPFDMICSGEGSENDTPFSILNLAVEALQAPGGKIMELEGRRKNGETFPLEACFSGWQGTEGLQYGAVLRDISVRKREEDRRRYRDIAEVSSDWIWECDEQLKFTYLSESFERVTGISPGQILGKTRHEIGQHADADWEGHLEDLAKRRPFRDFRYAITNDKGQTRYWSISGTPVFNNSGKFLGYRGAGSERTLQAKLSMKLAQQNERFDAALKNMSQGLCMFDRDQRLIVANDRYADMYGMPPETITPGITLRQILEHRIADGIIALENSEEYINERLEWVTKGTRTCKVQELTDGRSISIAHQPLPGGGWVTTHEDITGRKKAEEELVRHRDHLQEMVDMATADLKTKAEELREALGKEKKLNKLQREFVSMASHELRTPLSIIDGSAHMLARKAEDITTDYLHSKTEKIRDAVKRMTRLMESTLAAARMQDGKIEISIEPCDVGNIVREVCERQKDISRNHNIICDLSSLPATIRADSGCLEQVFTNLLSNAVKYSVDTRDIEVTAHRDERQVVISVRDHGIGIDADELDRIGERFFRARTSTGIAGTGIGLNLTKSLVEMHGGTLDAQSKKGEGSTFVVCLPIMGPDLLQQADNLQHADIKVA